MKCTVRSTHEVTEDMIFECFAAAQVSADPRLTAESFVDVEEYENRVMYPEFARWARKAGRADIAKLFLRVAGEEKEHSVWLRQLYSDLGTPKEGLDTARAKAALSEIRANCDRLIEGNADAVLEKALKVAIRVESREYQEIYPRFRDQALSEGNHQAADVYQRVIASERAHAELFQGALESLSGERVA